jgi:hypothetical protein
MVRFFFSFLRKTGSDLLYLKAFLPTLRILDIAHDVYLYLSNQVDTRGNRT